MLLLCVFLALANVFFAARSLDITRRSSATLEPCRPTGDFPFLSIVVPARNEERQIERCVRSLLAQHYPAFEVIVVDDRSEDATREILDRLARGDARLRVVVGEPLPESWVGKPWALQQGIAASRGDWLLSTDADTEHDPDAAGSAVVYALRNRLDALSLLTGQVMLSAGERLVLPSILWTIAFAIGPLDDVNDMSRPAALFNGQFVLMSRATYDAIGGYAALRSEIAEDLELARLLKADGRFRTALVGSAELVHTRMYRSLREVWAGFVKNFALGGRDKPMAQGLGLAFIACISPLSPLVFAVAALKGHALAGLLLGLAMLVAILAAEHGMRRMRFPRGSGWTLPVGMAVLLAIFVTSLVRLRSGRGVEWRGRTYR